MDFMWRDEFDALDPGAKMDTIRSGVIPRDRQKPTAKDEVYEAIRDALGEHWPCSGGDGDEFDSAAARICTAITPFLKPEAVDEA